MLLLLFYYYFKVFKMFPQDRVEIAAESEEDIGIDLYVLSVHPFPLTE